MNLTTLSKLKPTTIESQHQKIRDHLNDVGVLLLELYGKDLPLHHAFFAGGCIRDIILEEPIKDYDIYFESQEDVDRVKKYFNQLIENTENFEILSMADQQSPYIKITIAGNYNVYVKYENKWIIIQFITLIYGSPRDVVRQFDFTINMNYFTFASEDLIVSTKPNNKELIPGHNIYFPIHALCRIPKFLKRGYTISNNNLLQLAEVATGMKIPNQEKARQLFYTISGNEDDDFEICELKC